MANTIDTSVIETVERIRAADPGNMLDRIKELATQVRDAWKTASAAQLPPAYADVRNDFLGVLRHARRNTYILLHDTNIYVREIVRHAGVKRWLRVVQRHSEAFETIDFPFASGVAIVRVVDKDAWKHSTPP